MPDREVVKRFIATVEEGRYVEAIERFYAEDATMQENLQPPRQGRDALAAAERKVLAGVKDMRTLPGTMYLIEGDHVVINWVFEFTRPDGHFVHMDELARQRWAGDKILEERFYYDPGHLLPAKPG